MPLPESFTHLVKVGSPQETAAFGGAVASILHGGEIILLNGPLGAGKTCFVQGLCDGLAVSDEVVSPTFTLVNTYTGRLRVHHLDFYRVEDGDDLTDIGVPDILDEIWDGQAILLVEWPQPLLPELGANQPVVELLAQHGKGTEDRIWYLRGVPELPEPWIPLVETLGGGPVC